MNTHINGYALALFSIAEEEKKFETFKKTSLNLLSAINETPEYMELMDTKVIKVEKRQEMLTKAFGKIDKNIKNMLFILIERNKFRFVIKILNKLVSLINQKLGVREGAVYTSTPITKTQINKITKKVEKQMDVKLSLVNKIDKELLVGFKVVVGSDVIEDSAETRLAQLRKNLLSGKDN